MRRHLWYGVVPSLSVLGAFLALSSPSQGQQPSHSASKKYYVSADARPDGDGSRLRPFLLLSQAESASAAGDAIYLLSCGYSLYSSPYYRLWWRFFFRPRIPLTIAA